MKFKKTVSIITLLLHIFLMHSVASTQDLNNNNFISINQVTQGDSIENPIVVSGGAYYGDLPGPSELGGLWLEFFLQDPEYSVIIDGTIGTDYDFEVYDENGNFIIGANDSKYPDSVEISNFGGSLFVHVWGEPAGQFNIIFNTLSIIDERLNFSRSTYTPPPKVLELNLIYIAMIVISFAVIFIVIAIYAWKKF